MNTVADVVGCADKGADDGADAASKLEVTASLDSLARVRAFVRATAAGLGADNHALIALVQSVDEWVTNVVVHGYRGSGPVEVSVRRDGVDIVIDVRDEAPVFDPATAAPFDRDLPLERRPFGGMGIALIEDLMASFEHRALPHGNIVTLRHPAQSTDHPPGLDGGEL